MKEGFIPARGSLPDLLVWGSKHSTDRRQDEPSRPPTAYSLRKTAARVSLSGAHTKHFSPLCPPFQLLTERQMGKGVKILGRRKKKKKTQSQSSWSNTSLSRLSSGRCVFETVCMCTNVCWCRCRPFGEESATELVKQVMSSIRQRAQRKHITTHTQATLGHGWHRSVVSVLISIYNEKPHSKAVKMETTAVIQPRVRIYLIVGSKWPWF